MITHEIFKFRTNHPCQPQQKWQYHQINKTTKTEVSLASASIGAQVHDQHVSAEFIKKSVPARTFWIHELEYISLIHTEWNPGGHCFFHANSTHGCFHSNLLNGAYCCLSCGASGVNIISFTMAVYSLSYQEALQKLVFDWGLYKSDVFIGNAGVVS